MRIRIKEAEVMAKRIRDAVEEQCTNCEFKDGKYCSWSKKKRTGRPPCQAGKMLKQEQVKTPELEKMQAVRDDSQKIGEFLEWLAEQDIELAKWELHEEEQFEEMTPIRQTREQILAEFFGIDLVKCERERQALLDAVREDNN